jgi:hypothetical protein
MTTARVEKRQWRTGVEVTSPIASCVAAATPVNLHLLKTNRTCKIRKIHIFNGQPAPVTVDIGMGLGIAFAPSIPPIYVVNGMEMVLREEDIQDVEFNANITVQASAAGAAPANVQVQVTVEEYLGISG